jgi:hypothetical protein
MTLGPLTRQVLTEAGVDDAQLAGIDDGTYEWTIGPAPAYGTSADEETARRIAHDAAIRKDFAIRIVRSAAAHRMHAQIRGGAIHARQREVGRVHARHPR